MACGGRYAAEIFSAVSPQFEADLQQFSDEKNIFLQSNSENFGASRKPVSPPFGGKEVSETSAVLGTGAENYSESSGSEKNVAFSGPPEFSGYGEGQIWRPQALRKGDPRGPHSSFPHLVFADAADHDQAVEQGQAGARNFTETSPGPASQVCTLKKNVDMIADCSSSGCDKKKMFSGAEKLFFSRSCVEGGTLRRRNPPTHTWGPNPGPPP